MGKTLFVTGASSEMGTEIIRKIHGNYDTVIAHYRTMNDGLSQLKEKLMGGVLNSYAFRRIWPMRSRRSALLTRSECCRQRA